MSNTLTIEQVGDSLTKAIAQLDVTNAPIDVVQNGRTVAQLVPADDFVVLDKTITPEEAEEISRGLAISEADIAAGRVYTLDEARERLKKIWESRGETV